MDDNGRADSEAGLLHRATVKLIELARCFDSPQACHAETKISFKTVHFHTCLPTTHEATFSVTKAKLHATIGSHMGRVLKAADFILQ